MGKSKHWRPSPAMIVAVAALVVALGGSAYAATKAPKNSVVSRSIKNGQVKSADLANGGVRGVDLADGAVGNEKIGAGAVRGEQIAAAAVAAEEIAPGAVGTGALADGAVGTAKLKPQAVEGSRIADGSVSADDIAARAVGAEEIGPIGVVIAKSAATTDADGTENGGNVGIAKATAQCPPGTQLLSGGSNWVESSSLFTSDENVYIQEEHRSNGGTAWTVEGVVDYGAQGTIKLQAEAYCLDVGIGPSSS